MLSTVQSPKPFKLIVAGGRDFDNYALLSNEINRLAEFDLKDYAVSIVSGMARGADALAVRFALEHNVVLHRFPADWDKHGKGAGFMRNEAMASFADGLLAFWDGRSHGTEHMIRMAEKYMLKTRIIKYNM